MVRSFFLSWRIIQHVFLHSACAYFAKDLKNNINVMNERDRWVYSLNWGWVRQEIWPSLVQLMTGCLFGAKPLSEVVLAYYQLDPFTLNVPRWMLQRLSVLSPASRATQVGLTTVHVYGRKSTRKFISLESWNVPTNIVSIHDKAKWHLWFRRDDGDTFIDLTWLVSEIQRCVGW